MTNTKRTIVMPGLFKDFKPKFAAKPEKLIDMANAPDPVVENCDAYLTNADTGVIEINGDGWGIDYKQAEKMYNKLDVILREWATLEYEMESHNYLRMQADEDEGNPYHGTYSEL